MHPIEDAVFLLVGAAVVAIAAHLKPSALKVDFEALAASVKSDVAKLEALIAAKPKI